RTRMPASVWPPCASAWVRALPRCSSVLHEDMSMVGARHGFTVWGRGSLIAAWMLVCMLTLLAATGTAHAESLALHLPVLDDAEIVEQTQSDFDTYPLITERSMQRGGIEGIICSTRTVEGRLLQTTYKLEAESAAELVTAITTTLEENGYEQLFDCDGDACGPTVVQASPGYRQNRDRFDVELSQQHYRAFKKAAEVGGRYVAVQAVDNK